MQSSQALDATDPLRSFRKEFIIPVIDGKEQIYFLGNSLGLQPKGTAAAINEVLSQWSTHGVESFFVGDKPWLAYHSLLQPPLAKIVGALPQEVVVMNQLTVNLHLMMVSFYKPSGKRKKILCEAKAFPSDQYAFETHVRQRGLEPDEVIIEVSPEPGEQTIRLEAILKAIEEHKDELALVLWGGLNYYSGQVFDMAAITKAGQAAGAKVGFDLAHAAGNIPLELHNWNVDFACWCSYKYLNAGPGGIGAAFIHERYHRDPSIPRLAGWWGYDADTRFQMAKGFIPATGAEGWQLSTPSILLYACQKASLDLFEKAGMDALHSKRRLLNEFLWSGLDEVQQDHPGRIEIITPRDPAQRGCQVSMLIKKDGRQVYDALMKEGIIVDWREPDVIRLAPVPLYNTFEEVETFIKSLKRILS